MGGVDYESKAKEAERNAVDASRLSTITKKYTTQDVFEFYKSAGDYWLLHIKNSILPTNKIKDALSYSLWNYKRAKKIPVGDKDKQSIVKRITSVNSKLESLVSPEEGEPIKVILPFLSIAFLLSALFFTSVSLTGYSVFELTQNNSLFIGTIFFICGLVFAFVYFKRKKFK